MLFDGNYGDEVWKKGEPRESRFIFIGKNIDKKYLTDGFNKCVAADLRFDVGEIVWVRVDKEFVRARILKQWDGPNPYLISLTEKKDHMYHILYDRDTFITKNKPKSDSNYLK